MLKHTTVCVVLLAASAMAWLRLKDVPHEADVDSGAHLVWGDGLVWGVFPTDDGPTYLFTYDPDQDPDPDSAQWDTLQVMSGAQLWPCNITFQRDQDPTLWGIGYTGTTGLSYLKHYVESGDYWVEDTIDEFELGEGACIAYAPNPDFDLLVFPIPGYLYCLPGGDSTWFWRYNIAATDLPDPGLYGYLYPDTGATIADQTPTFRWNPGYQQYRIQASTDLAFSAGPEIDTVVFANEFESTIELSNGVHYWRVAHWSGGWVWGCATYWFTLDGGWTNLNRSIDSLIGIGAEIAYDAGSFPFNNPGIIAIYGRHYRRFSRYVFETEQWECKQWDDTPLPVYCGSSLTTSALVEGAFPYHIDAAFRDQQEGDYPYIFCADSPPGYQWQQFILEEDTGDYYTGFPDDLERGSSMIIGADSFSYLVTGHGNRFYRVEPAGFAGRSGKPGGGKSRVTTSESAKAQVIAMNDGIEVEYELPAAARVRAVLHDAVGRRIGMLDAGEQNAGTHRLVWSGSQEGRKLSAGAYFMLLDMGKEQARLKAVVR